MKTISIYKNSEPDIIISDFCHVLTKLTKWLCKNNYNLLAINGEDIKEFKIQNSTYCPIYWNLTFEYERQILNQLSYGNYITQIYKFDASYESIKKMSKYFSKSFLNFIATINWKFKDDESITYKSANYLIKMLYLKLKAHKSINEYEPIRNEKGYSIGVKTHNNKQKYIRRKYWLIGIKSNNIVIQRMRKFLNINSDRNTNINWWQKTDVVWI